MSALTGTTTPVQTHVVSHTPAKIQSTEQYVRQYFRDIPIMIEIAKCESRFRQLDSDGEVHRGDIDPRDIGVMQINEHFQGDAAERGNYDIYTIEGNTAYARKLYLDQGTTPWNSSRACWGKSQDLAKA